MIHRLIDKYHWWYLGNVVRPYQTWRKNRCHDCGYRLYGAYGGEGTKDEKVGKGLNFTVGYGYDLCDNKKCYGAKLLRKEYPQGWSYYPGDVCPHGMYTGGCGIDWICGACESGE